MIKKILLILVFCCVLISCGKKGNPRFENSEPKADLPINIVNDA